MAITIAELIRVLEAEPNKDLIVCVEADHRQTPMKVTGHGTGTVESTDEYMMEYAADEETATPNMFVLQGY